MLRRGVAAVAAAAATAAAAAIVYGVVVPLLLCVWTLKLSAWASKALQQRRQQRGPAAPLAAHDAAEPLVEHDAAWLSDTPTQPMVVNAVAAFEPPRLALSQLRALITKRVLGIPALARFSRLLIPDAFSRTGFSWVPDLDFDVANHVVAVAHDEAPHTEAELQAWLGRLAAVPLPRERPLWSVLLIEDFADGASVFVFRCHHCIGDGIVMSGVLLEQLMDALPASADPVETGVTSGAIESEARQQPRARRHADSDFQRACRAARGMWESPSVLCGLLWRPDDANAVHGLWELTGTKRIAWSDPVPLATVKAVKNTFGRGCTVNDVLISAVAAALDVYIHERTEHLTASDAEPRLSAARSRKLHAAAASEVTLMVPFNARSRVEMGRVVLENKFAVLFLPLPLKAADARSRLAGVMRAMQQLKSGAHPFAMWTSLLLVQRLLPSTWATWAIDALADSASAIVTNNRGPSSWLYLDGRRCTYYVSWAPARASVGISVTVYTYADSMRCSVIADSSCSPEPGRLVELFSREFAALVEQVEARGASPSASPLAREPAMETSRAAGREEADKHESLEEEPESASVAQPLVQR